MKKAITMKKITIAAAAILLCCFAIAVFSACEDKETPAEKVYMKYDTVYELDEMTLWERDFIGFMDKEKTYVKLTADGELEVRITPNKTALQMANIALAGIGSSDPEASVDVSGFEKYVKGLFPTEGFDDMKKTIERLESDLGLYVEGIDYESEKVKALLESIKNDGAIPMNITIPENIAFVLKGKYELKEIVSKTQDEPLRAVYFGNYSENDDPYVILTQFTDEKGTECIRVRNELLFLDAVASVKPPILKEAE